MPPAPPREAAGFLSDPAALGTRTLSPRWLVPRPPWRVRGSWNQPSGRGCGFRMGLEDLLAGLTGPHAVALLHRKDEHLAVAHGPRPRMLEDRVDDRLHVAVGDHAFELHLRAQVVRQLRSAVALGDPLLPARALDLADAQRGKAQGQQLHADRLERLMA